MSQFVSQASLLPAVSRTFGLTIPQLPVRLRTVVTNAYLLCRIADTIEDNPGLEAREKESLQAHFLDLLESCDDPSVLAKQLDRRLGASVDQGERRLLSNIGMPIGVFHELGNAQQSAILRCLKIMLNGMSRYERQQSREGLANLSELRQYCYHVAGVVGEMLTELFCDYAPDIDANREGLCERSIAFGEGLQLTNILKDVWDDYRRGTCWLPADLFGRAGCTPGSERMRPGAAGFAAGVTALTDYAHIDLREAFEYVCLIPPRHIGIRRFCLWAIYLAEMTLSNIARNPDYRSGHDVKVSHSRVRFTGIFLQLFAFSDRANRMVFRALEGPLRARNGGVGMTA